MKNKLADIRKVYMKGSINVAELPENPFEEFKKWMEQAIEAEAEEPTAFVLSTLSEDQFPTSRVVLLKEFNEHGFVFFTNYNSRKGRELTQHPKVSMNFFWTELERQVRILGMAERISPEESDTYFYSRPIESQAGAVVSAQSQTIDPDLNLAEEVQKLLQSGNKIIRPEHWGGIRIRPVYFEFWQGRPSRIHDRAVYEKTEQGWAKCRLAP